MSVSRSIGQWSGIVIGVPTQTSIGRYSDNGELMPHGFWGVAHATREGFWMISPGNYG